MKWAIIGALTSDSLEYHLIDSLNHLGHTTKHFDIQLPVVGFTGHYWLRRFSKKYDVLRARKLANDVLKYKPDVVLVTYRIVNPVTIDIIKQADPSIIVMHMNPDALSNLEQQQVVASNYDYWFVKDPYMQQFLKEKAGLNAYYLPEAFNPRFHRTVQLEKRVAEQNVNIDILIFGNLYPYRVRQIEQLVRNKLNVTLFGVEGPFFPKVLRPYFNNHLILGSEKATMIRGAKIVFNNFHYSEIEGVNCKYFEINGIGGFQICDYKPSLVDYSPIDPNRYAFQNMDNAIELIRHYLNNPEERQAIADANQAHFLKNHTYENRMQFIISLITKEPNQ